MKVVFINDTRAELNPGCQATVTELISFVKLHINNAEIELLPHGNSYDAFKEGNIYQTTTKTKIKNLYIKIGNKFKLFKKTKDRSKAVNFSSWKQTALNKIPETTRAKIEVADLVLINMEGTIHHNGLGALALLGLAYYAKSQDKIVAMVNGSYQNMSKAITLEVLSKIDFLSVREIKSYNALKKSIASINLIPDFAFRASINNGYENLKSIVENTNDKKCLYTVGVLGAFPNQKKGIGLEQITTHIAYIKQLGYKPYYLKIESSEDNISNHLKTIGIETISYDSGLNYNNIGTLISKFDLLVTGRYHIGIFGLMSNIKTLFLPSNTYKIEGLLKMINQDHLMVKGDNINLSLAVLAKKGQKEIENVMNEEAFNVFGEFLRKL